MNPSQATNTALWLRQNPRNTRASFVINSSDMFKRLATVVEQSNED